MSKSDQLNGRLTNPRCHEWLFIHWGRYVYGKGDWAVGERPAEIKEAFEA